MSMNVYVLFETDEWGSHSSRLFRGVFEDYPQARLAGTELENFVIIDPIMNEFYGDGL